MAKITIDRDKCKGCGLCVDYCPKGLIKLDSNLNKRGIEPAQFANSLDCLACAFCALICPDCCIEVWK